MATALATAASFSASVIFAHLGKHPWQQNPTFCPFHSRTIAGSTGSLLFTAQYSLTVTIVPTPGHTPGHQSVAVASVTGRAFIAGDLAPTQAVLEETDWVFGYDGDPATNIATRNRIFAQLEAQGEIAAFGHFVTPNCIGRVVRENGRRVFKPLLS